MTLDNLSARLDLFNASGQGFQAVRRGRVVHVRSVDEPSEVTSALERPFEIKNAIEIPALTAVYSVVVEAISGVAPSGIAGSGPMPGPDCPLEQVVRLPQGSLTAIALLDRIVEQAPGLAWLVTYDTEQPHANLKVGVLCPDGSTSKINVFPGP